MNQKMLEYSPDLVIVGGGLAGLTAALSAVELNCRPVVLEAGEVVGGTTLVSGGVFNSYDPERQIAVDIEDSPEKHLHQLIEAGRGKSDRTLAKTLCYEAFSALKWLEYLGLAFEVRIRQAPGAPYPRSHYPADGAGGGAYIRLLSNELVQRGVALLTRCRVVDLMREGAEGGVNGVRFVHDGKSHSLTGSRGVVLASGGFCSNPTLVGLHCPPASELASACAPNCDGLMMLKAADCGAALTQMSYFVWDYPDEAAGRNSWLKLLSNAATYVLVDDRGRRFVREDIHRSDQIEAFLMTPGKRGWMVASERCFPTEGRAQALPFDQEALAETLWRYDAFVQAGRDKDFGKNPRLLKPIAPPWRCRELKPKLFTSLGGVRIDEKARVIDRYGHPIPGLSAAGDVVGGIHGEWASRGDCIASAVVFGRRAARSLCQT